MDSVVASEAIDPGSTPGARTKHRIAMRALRSSQSEAGQALWLIPISISYYTLYWRASICLIGEPAVNEAGDFGRLGPLS